MNFNEEQMVVALEKYRKLPNGSQFSINGNFQLYVNPETHKHNVCIIYSAEIFASPKNIKTDQSFDLDDIVKHLEYIDSKKDTPDWNAMVKYGYIHGPSHEKLMTKLNQETETK